MQAGTHVARDLSELLLALDPSRPDWDELSRRLEARRQEIRKRLDELGAELEARLGDRATEAAGAARSTAVELERLAGAATATRHRLYTNLAQSYERLARALDALPEKTSLPAAKPSRANVRRSVFHVLGGVGAALIYHFLLTRAQAIGVMALVSVVLLGLEIGRRISPRMNDALMRVFAPIARPHEYHRANSTTLYALGLLTAAALFPQAAVELGCVVLAVGDPAASTIGRRFGRKKLVGDKSWAGTIAFVVASAVAAFVYAGALHPELARVEIALAVGLAGAIAELFSSKLDDNLTVPLAVALATYAVT